MQSYAVPSSQVPGYSHVIRHPDYKDGTHKQKYKEVTTLWDLFQREVNCFPEREFLGSRAFDAETSKQGGYRWTTTTEAGDIVENLGSGLDHVYAKYAPGIPAATPGQQPLAVCVPNRPEWLLAEFAAFRSRRYTVGVSDGVDVENAELAIGATESAVVVCSLDKVPRILERIGQTPCVKAIISMDALDGSAPTVWTEPLGAEKVAELARQAEALGVALLDMAGVAELGRQKPTAADPPSPGDISTVCFTSGTLAAKKGAVYTHASAVFAAKCAFLSSGLSDCTYLSFVPLSCCSERNTVYALMLEHVRIGMFSGAAANVIGDFQTLQPTVFLTDPTLLNKVYERAAAATIRASGAVGALSRYAYDRKLRLFRSGGGARHAFWDRVVFSRVARIFGGRVRTVYCGGTALIPEVQDFFRIALSCDLLQGYGQTEMCGCGVIQLAADTTTGSIGVPMPGVDVRLRSVPEMGLLVTNPDRLEGELMVRGGCLYERYLRAPEDSAPATDGSGWLATQDIAQLNKDGSIRIVGRMRNSFKTARFCWVAPEPMELLYAAHPLIRDIFVHGTPDERDLVAIVAPEPKQFTLWAQMLFRTYTRSPKSTAARPSFKELCTNKDVREALVDVLRNVALDNNIQSRAYIAAVHCDPVSFENCSVDLFTSTRKLRRNVAAEFYKKEIEQLFTELGNSESPENLKK
ncbi:medium-chain fatty acid-CoA ligase faa2 [Coemansia sp. RSA 2049]|nr:medium-chain fatty acid-CoA ligase faa2 [Coemansia sp. RSA 1939]KAJ2522250.1 medium-chain fatty acid-CoA ligase faa2 [Coemansia sp. RSA 2049]KAJ2618283.1 medium-chain fatty acid-CoA ligase faa2 [Coemansia sp. RSA 1804]KAJ2693831.1 medium-chain fatty acid-CoA ligase faa2 [Coemansia sp. RSA 1285]